MMILLRRFTHTFSLLLGGVMGARFFRSGKFFPAGVISALSLSLAIKSAYHMLTIKDDK